MKIRVSELRIGIDEDTNILKQLACQKLKVSASQVKNWWIERQSLDARRKKEIAFVYTVVLVIENQLNHLKESLPPKSSIVDTEEESLNIKRGDGYLKYPPLVIGTGPSGLFAAWLLAKWGYNPVVIERGKSVFARQRDVARFWDDGELDTDSNVQFGEGGAGTFSDGKLTTRVKDKRVKLILEALVEAGAPQEVMYQAKPHLGTDKLRNIVANIRKDIIRLGGKVFFQAKATDFIVKNGAIEAVIINKKYEIPVSKCILATGHSARDTYEALWKTQAVKLEAKPFAVGLRVEHPQHMIDCAQHGEWAGNPRLGAADYHLTYRNTNLNRAAYSFCMCPGGYVIGASSEPGSLAVNGMSYHDRSSGTSNSAVVVSVGEKDYDYKDPLAGIKFQRNVEKKAYQLGGGGFTAPVQTVDDFINDTIKETPSRLNQATYRPKVKEANLRDCLPQEIGEVLGEALQDFNKKIWGFGTNKGILTGVETRTSAPLRIPRDDNYQALEIAGLYPTGEGAGYAGGIISAAVDGIRVAQAIIEKFGLPKDTAPIEELED